MHNIILILLLTAISTSAMAEQVHVKSYDEIEHETWESARDTNDIDVVKEFVKQYPKGRFTGLAKVLIAKLKSQQITPAEAIVVTTRKSNVEGDLWTEVQDGNSVDDYNAYLAQYPRGKYVALAKSRIKKLQDEATVEVSQKERNIWSAAEKTGSMDSYQGYLKGYPAGRYAGLAQVRISKLQANHKTESVDSVMIPIPGKNFEIGKYEVTQGKWRSLMGNNPSYFNDCGDTCPVENVSWNDAQVFIQKLNAKTGNQYRLPTEAEWEYACYGGSQTEYCGGNDIDAVGWYGDNGQPGGNSEMTTHPAGQKLANGYGLHDMTGNVAEWMSDCLKEGCDKRVIRGGSLADDSQFARASHRIRGAVEIPYSSVGFRLARTLP